MNASPPRRLGLRAKLALLAAIWFLPIPVPAAYGSSQFSDDDWSQFSDDDWATLALLDLGCEEATGVSWLPFWLNP